MAGHVCKKTIQLTKKLQRAGLIRVKDSKGEVIGRPIRGQQFTVYSNKCKAMKEVHTCASGERSFRELRGWAKKYLGYSK